MKVKVKTPRQRRGAHHTEAGTETRVGDLADRVAEAQMYGPGEHKLAHGGRILKRESRVLDAINYLGAKAEFELVLG